MPIWNSSITVKLPINLSILDFKYPDTHDYTNDIDSINLSILDFKSKITAVHAPKLKSINLSILDFK